MEASDLWEDWQWAAWWALRRQPGLTAADLLKKVGPRRHGVGLVDLERFLPELLAYIAEQETQRAQQQEAAIRRPAPPSETVPDWRLVDPAPFPAAAYLAVALIGKQRRRPLPLGLAYSCATWWSTPAGRVAGIAYQDLPPPTPGPGGVLIATMGPRFQVLATAAGLHVQRLASDPSPADLATGRAAIERLCSPETLQAYAAAVVAGCRNPACLACGRPLADPLALGRGFGPECWGKVVDAIRGQKAVSQAIHSEEVLI